jgi:D-alanyl-D-alanine carboxypeptidase
VLRRLSAVLLLGASLLSMKAAAAPPDRVDGPASASGKAQPMSPMAADVVTVNNSGALTQSNAQRALDAARAAGASAAVGRSASVGMIEVRRGGGVVQAAPAGFAYPMGTTVLPLDMVARTMGRSVSGKLSANTMVMGALTAGLRGAAAGDTVTLIASSGALTAFTIAAVLPDATIGGTEILMSPEGADRLGITDPSRVVIWNFSSRESIDAALAAQGLVSTSVRIRRSWDAFDPDLTLGVAETKAALGEFAYRVNGDGSVSLDSGWLSRSITGGSVGGLRLQTGCHVGVRPALEAAMAEVVASGLSGTINYVDANRAGGCFLARFNRLTPDSALGFLSRHSWGMAVDTNTIGSCQGCAPPDMDCRTVRIFREHGFAWGGNFLVPDGMHFEWVGQPRDGYAYPSRFCPNIASGASAALQEADTQRASLFSSDGFVPEG